MFRKQEADNAQKKALYDRKLAQQEERMNQMKAHIDWSIRNLRKDVNRIDGTADSKHNIL